MEEQENVNVLVRASSSDVLVRAFSSSLYVAIPFKAAVPKGSRSDVVLSSRTAFSRLKLVL